MLIADKVVWHISLTSKGIFKKLGLTRNRKISEYTINSGGKLNYDLSKIDLHITHPYNVVWLVSESLRWDMLNSETMPKTYKFSGNCRLVLSFD